MYRTSPEQRPLLIVAEAQLVRALSVADGTEAWSAVWSEGTGPPELVVARDAVIIATVGKLYCLDYYTGEGRWRADIVVNRLAARPTLLVAGDRIYVSMGPRVACYDFEGRQRWANDDGRPGHDGRAMGLPDRVRQADVGPWWGGH